VVNNASAINVTPVAQTEMRRFDLMHQINTRGTFVVCRYALPYLEKAENPHILMLSPAARHEGEMVFRPHGYAIAKFGMSLVVLGLAGETRGRIGVNALWPRTTIATAAIQNLLGGDAIMRMSRTPENPGGGGRKNLRQAGQKLFGNFLIDDTFLAGEGVTDFDRYRFDPSQPLAPDFFVPDDSVPPPGVSLKPKT